MLRRRRTHPGIDDIRVIHGWAPPGASAMTLGRIVFVRRGVPLEGRLLRHEYEHVRQYHDLGVIGFLVRYVGEYLRLRVRVGGHKAAYRRISYEVRAEWRARRDLGIGTSSDQTPG